MPRTIAAPDARYDCARQFFDCSVILLQFLILCDTAAVFDSSAAVLGFAVQECRILPRFLDFLFRNAEFCRGSWIRCSGMPNSVAVFYSSAIPDCFVIVSVLRLSVPKCRLCRCSIFFSNTVLLVLIRLPYQFCILYRCAVPIIVLIASRWMQSVKDRAGALFRVWWAAISAGLISWTGSAQAVGARFLPITAQIMPTTTQGRIFTCWA